MALYHLELKFWFVGTFKRSNHEQVTILYDAGHDNYVLKKSDGNRCIYLATPEEYKLQALAECAGFDEYLIFTHLGFKSNTVQYGRQH